MPTGDDANKNFRMGTWLVQPDLNHLSDGDRVVSLEPRLMDLLTCLASRPGEIVSADDLLDRVWHGRALVDNTIYQAVAHLRKVLSDDIHNPRYIQTIPKKGYRLICPVTSLSADSEIPEIVLHSPNGRRHRRRHIAIFAGIASIAVVIVLTAIPELRDQLLQTNEGTRDRSVAVLPFVDMSEDGSQQYLSDGVTEELIHVLSNLPDLRVAARTSSFAFRDSNEDIRQIGSKLNVATLLEGSVRKDGDRIRVTSQLVDTRNGYHLWSQTFDRRTTDIFSIQSEIAVAVAKTFEYQQLDAIASDDPAAQSDKLQTYEFYLLGLYQQRKRTPSGFMLAIQHFESAIKMDPSFARAYAGLAHSYASRYWYEGNQEYLDKAESAAEYALLLDDQSAESFAALGSVKGVGRDYSGAEVAYRKAIALNPNNIRAYKWLASNIALQGRKEEALVVVKKALELHPKSGVLNDWMGRYYNTMDHRHWDIAFDYFKRAMELDPDYRAPYRTVGLYYFSTGQLDQAIPYFSKVVDLTTGPTKAGLYTGLLASTYVDIGDYAAAKHVIRRAKELEPHLFDVVNSEIQLQLALRDFSAARDIVHGLLPTYIDKHVETSLMAFYEMVIGDKDHAQEIYTRLGLAPEAADIYGNVYLYRSNELGWGMLGAVNLAYLHKNNGNTRTAQQLIGKARDYIESMSDHPLHMGGIDSDYPLYVGGIAYVLAQIAAVEGNTEAAIDHVREAVESGWTKAWFGRVDPIMADLRKDARYTQMLDELEVKLLEMREHRRMLASIEP